MYKFINDLEEVFVDGKGKERLKIVNYLLRSLKSFVK